MAERKLHPTIVEFKDFVKKHPKLVAEVRNGNKTWQEYYEDWYLFGEEDEMWKPYRSINDEPKENSSKSETMASFFSALKNIDMNQMQQHIANASNVIASIQNIIQQFQGGNASETKPQVDNHAYHPFSFRKD